MMHWIYTHWTEIIGASLSLLYLILEVKQNWIMWIVGIISSVFYVFIFFEAKLYAETGLNLYYAVLSVYGLYSWKLASTKDDTNRAFQHLSIPLTVILTIITFVVFVCMIFILVRYTDSTVPIPDALVTALGIVAIWMTAKKIVECWYLWIFANIFATGLYISQNLYPTAILYVVYSVLSFIGLIEWRKSVTHKQ
ncbi:MAG: nicotinamide riboside transporter PnuC [Candidatus Azobacteroides sp.]|nr:nicotinamide riboside transporter PnuC [Candidatus Azobacteroides sp.]